MGIQRLNHAVFRQAADSTNDHDPGLFSLGKEAANSGAGQTAVGLYHLAWEVDTLTELQRIGDALQEGGYLAGASDYGATIKKYGQDTPGGVGVSR